MAAKLRKMAKSPLLFPPPGGGRKQHNAFPVYPGYVWQGKTTRYDGKLAAKTVRDDCEYRSLLHGAGIICRNAAVRGMGLFIKIVEYVTAYNKMW